MVVYLTSSPTGAYRGTEENDFVGLNPANGFVEELKKDWKEDSGCLILSADPRNYEMNDAMVDFFWDAFEKSGLSVRSFEVCDNRNAESLRRKLQQCDLVILGGGHVPTQNKFFETLRLRQLLRKYNGILMGISAGSMNCAEEVYAQPELQGESRDPMYRRFIEGLGLTRIRVIPHYQAIKNDRLDGKRLMEDITYPDSVGRRFFVLVDGSYILQRNGIEELHGEGYLIVNGGIRKICEKDQVYRIEM